MELDAEPPSSPLSDVPSDFDVLDNDGLDGPHEHGGPVRSAAEEAPEQELDSSSLSSAPQELTTVQTPSDVFGRVVPIDTGSDGMEGRDEHKSSAENQVAPAELEGDEKQSTDQKLLSDIPDDTEAQGRPARKRKVPNRYEDHLDSSPPHLGKEPKLCEEHLNPSPPRPKKIKRRAGTNDTHPLSNHHPDSQSFEAEVINNIPQCEAELDSTNEPMMDSEKALQPRAHRSRRQRKPPQSYNEPGSDGEFVADAPTQCKKTSNGGEKPKRVAPTWMPDYLLQDPKSRLGKVNLTAIIKDPRAWESLSKEQQIQLIKLLPNVPGLDLDPTNMDSKFLYSIVHEFLSNSALLSDIAMFGEDLREGRLDPDWQRDGQAAMEMRARGDFDDWKVQEMEAFWGQKQKLQHDVLAGESSKIKLDELVREGTVQVGDVWVYKRNFPKDGAVVEKEAKVISITQDHKIVFSFPPGTAKFSSPNAGEDVVTEPLSGPQQLGDAMIKEDGRVSSYRNNNAWKEYRVFRNQNDIGHLWERRELYWAKKTEGGHFK